MIGHLLRIQLLQITMSNNIKQQLHLFFPGQTFPDEEIEDGLEGGDILTERGKILPLLQTALLDEKVLEVELDGNPRVSFSRLRDDPPDQPEDEDGVDTVVDVPEYNQGDYLKAMNYLITLPLEPGLGSMHLRYSRFIVLRMFTNTYAVELGCTYEETTKVGELPVLKLSFPKLARIVRNAREFRAKVPDVMNFFVVIHVNENLPALTTRPVDISIRGMSFSVTKDEQKLFLMDTVHSFKLYINEEIVMTLDGTVRHLSKVRKKSGIEYVCGVEFDLITPKLATVVEATVASVQRTHIKDLAEKSDASGINLIA